MKKYRAAFYRNDEKRYTEFLQKVTSGEVKLHADTLYPYELVLPYIHDRFWRENKGFMRDMIPPVRCTGAILRFPRR